MGRVVTNARPSGSGNRPLIVSTSDAPDLTWATGKVYLGTWCLARSPFTGDADGEILPYHWDDRRRLERDAILSSATYENLLPKLCIALNRELGVTHSERYWRILVGPWLSLFTQVVLDRLRSISTAAQYYPSASLLTGVDPSASRASLDMSQFVQDIRSDIWNDILYCDLTRLSTSWDIFHHPTLHSSTISSQSEKPHSLRRRIAIKILATLEKTASLVVNHLPQTLCTYQDYLPPLRSLQLALSMGNIPRLVPLSVFRPTTDSEQQQPHRTWQIPCSTQGGLESVVASLIPLYLPKSYLEEFGRYQRSAARASWPSSPSVAFTANAFESDDDWKHWAAQASELGTRIVLAQHGGNYGTTRFCSFADHEITISDRYLSWGWTGDSPKIVASVPTKLLDIRRRRVRRQLAEPHGIMALASLPRWSYWLYNVPVGPQFVHYIEDQINLLLALPESIRARIILRLPANDFGWDLRKRIVDAVPEVTFDPRTRSLNYQVARANISICTYNATTFLESISIGTPTVMHWNPEHWEMNSAAQESFDRLRRAEILFDDPIACANKIREIWEDPSVWWQEKKSSSAVKDILNHYALMPKRPMRTLRQDLTF